MVLAAGVGSRLDPLTRQIPKPLVPVANRPVMDHILRLLNRHGVREVISNLHYLPDRIENYFGDGSRQGVELTYHYEEELSGDAGGVRACRAFLSAGTFLVLMGDLLTDADLTDVVRQHKAKGALATIAVKEVEDVTQFGVVLTDSAGFITGFQEKPKPQEALSNYASTGIYVLEPEVFEHIPREGTYGFGRQLFPALVAKGEKVLAVEIHNYWSDVGTIRQYRLSNFDALDGVVDVEVPGRVVPFGWIGANSFVDDSCQISGKLLVGDNCRIKGGVKIRGHVIVADNCVIERDAEIEDSVIWSNTTIERGAVVIDSVIGFDCRIRNGSSHTEAANVAAFNAEVT